MTYRRWKPSASQRKAFAERMKDPEQRAEYEANKAAKAAKRRSRSVFEYGTAGGNYYPTKAQYDFVVNNPDLFVSTREQDAANMITYGWTCNEKVHHDNIHIVNEKIRAQ